MSLQADLNDEALKHLPEVLKVIHKAEAFEANQMHNAAIQHMLNSDVAVAHMDASDLTLFQEELLEYFKYQEWL